MNKLLMILMLVGLTVGASAQPKIGSTFHGNAVRGGGVTYTKPRVTVIAPVYPYYGYNYGFNYGFRYSPIYDPFYYSPRFQSKPTQLDLDIEDIKNDYSYRISTVKKDKSLPKDERKQKVRDLKHEREDAIIEAKKNYYKQDHNDAQG